MEVDESEQYLATGDVNGIVKIWNIRKIKIIVLCVYIYLYVAFFLFACLIC